MKKNKYRLRELKREHNRRKRKTNKYESWVRHGFAITEYNPGKYRIEAQLKKLMY